jgi:SagB-type dehydrogenase family enzyme
MTAIQEFLLAMRVPRTEPIDWRAAPPTYHRYPADGHIELPWESDSTAGHRLVALGGLLRELLGLRVRWTHPHDDSGIPLGGPPRAVIARPAPSGGGLYPIEVFVATGSAPGLPAALYHYDAAHHCLDLVRTGDHRTALAGLLARPPLTPPELVLVPSAAFWRNGFKYGEFAYQLHCLETGVLSTQAEVLAGVGGTSATTHLDFADQPVRELLGLDAAREGPLALLTLGAEDETGPSGAELAALPARRPDNPPPPVDVSLPRLFALHRASAKVSGAGPRCRVEPPPGESVRLPTARQVQLAEGITARASADAGYLPHLVDQPTLHAVLASAAATGPVGVYVLVQRVSELAAGCYHFAAGVLTRIDGSAAVADGPLAANTRRALATAAFALIPVGDPTAGLAEVGDRWYRLLHIETGRVLHRATLAAFGLGLATRIHSEGANDTTDAALGLSGTGYRSCSFLLAGLATPSSLPLI